MRELVFDLSDDNYLPKSGFGGFEGEHNATGIALLLPERLLAPDAVYYMVFETEKNGEVIFSAPLLPDENRIYATLPRQVMLAPRVSIHAAAYRKNGEELAEIAKSARAVLEIKYPQGETERELSTDGGEIPGLVIESALLPESENPVSSRALHGELSSLAGEQVERAFVNEAGELILKKKNRKELCAGAVVGPQGERGPQGEQGIQGEKGERGEGAVYYKYDFNGDGRVNEDDVDRLLYYVNFSQAPEYRPSWWSDPDVNGDGVVGDEDVATLQNWLGTGNEAAYAIAPKNELVDDHFSATSEKPIRNKAVSAGAANALKGTASGTLVAMKDVSPLEHPIGVKLSSDTVTAFSSVTLKKYGKNLLVNTIPTTDFANGTKVVKNQDGSLTVTKRAGDLISLFSEPFYLPKGTYTFSNGLGRDTVQSGLNPVYLVLYEGATTNTFATLYSYDKSTISLESGYYRIRLYGPADVEFDTFTIRPMIELGETATEYEPYKEPETVPVKQDGTASIIGKGEGITLMTDTDGVTITAEYNRDVNKALADLEAKLQALILEV